MQALTPERVTHLLDEIAGVRVLVVGDAMLDREVRGTVDRISPEAPVPVLAVSDERHAPGGAANVSANVVALGASCELVAGRGADEAGRLLEASLEAIGVEATGLLELAERRTTVKTRVKAGQHQIVRLDSEDAADFCEASAKHVAEAARARLPGADVLVLQDYDKGLLVPYVIDRLLGAAADRGIPVVVDPKRRRFFGYSGSSVFKPNVRELSDALGEKVLPDDCDWMESVRRRLACETLLVTLGADGVVLADEEEGYVRIPALARSVYDVSGAGDTVTAILAVSLAAGATRSEAARLANHGAALEVGRAGVEQVSPTELHDHILRHGA